MHNNTIGDEVRGEEVRPNDYAKDTDLLLMVKMMTVAVLVTVMIFRIAMFTKMLMWLW